MNQLIALFLLLAASYTSASNPAGDKIKTPWAEKVTSDNVWREYPRPQLKRADWMNMNGLWKYAITGREDTCPQTFEGDILVPFCVESSLSGVERKVTEKDKIWYETSFTVPPAWKQKNVILHFAASDYLTAIWVNNKLVGSHKGGFDAFSFDVTSYLKKAGRQKLVVSVWDPTDMESQARGKQRLDQRGIWYTPVSGIWQTVWLEPVSKAHIASVLPATDIEKSSVTLLTDLVGVTGKEKLQITIRKEGKVIIAQEVKADSIITMTVPDAEWWTPATPHLYDVEMKLTVNGKESDHISTYFAMRKISKGKDAKGYNRICLNNEPVFQYGTLDQGWWPDGLHTPPSAGAMLWDMLKLKEMGFNTIRKHIKVEPALYYYYADSLGLMLWQDMPSGMVTANKKTEHIAFEATSDWDRPAGSAEQWETELKAMIHSLRFFPSITTWVVFNEGWGQYDTKRVVEWVMDYDKERLVDGVSGWTDRGVGDFFDQHNYPATSMEPIENCKERIPVLGEFGGLGLPLQGHIWNPDMRNWGYKNIGQSNELIDNYARLIYDLEGLVSAGLSAAIYTQTTDVEGEVNGLITYDRKQVKIPEQLLRTMHARLYAAKPLDYETLVKKRIEGKTPVVSFVETFELPRKPETLMLSTHLKGNTKVWINGKLILNQDVRQTHHANQHNFSDYIEYLRTGKNELRVESQSKGDGFEIQLRAGFDR